MMFNVEKYAALARQAIAEGCVLLENKNNVLPLPKGVKIASFGRGQFNYFKSGTGSGGLVNTSYEVSVLDALKGCEDVVLDNDILTVYEAWIAAQPEQKDGGWASEPWSMPEMPLEEELVKTAAAKSDIALITIARTAGEDKDNSAEAGSYLLTPEEEQMLSLVCRYFSKTVVLLNVGNIIDMKWVEAYNPSAVLYIWQGGQEGGNGVLDLLTGAVSPSGKLSDTIAKDIADYPSTANFGSEEKNIYVEDIYVGYRYFETFAKDKVLYPFGFGLSYTVFETKVLDFTWDGEKVSVKAEVKNTGNYPGKEVVQLYVQAPQGALGKAVRVLCGFVKTKELQPEECQIVEVSCSKYELASYDDSGASGYKSAYVLEAGEYVFYAGNSVRTEMVAGSFCCEETELIQQLESAMSPVEAFDRMRPIASENGWAVGYEAVPLREYNLWDRIQANRPADIAYTGDKGYKLADVRTGKVSMEEFVAQIPKRELSILFRGEGMNSPKVTPGTAAAFGGLSPALQAFGVPAACCTDGPSGIRMDVGALAFSLPNGTCLACSFNEELSYKLFDMMGIELRKNKVDTLLGPGMNIHRNPLNGRNFEYFSEDPFLTGKMAAAQLKGMHKHNVTGTVKHFTANNQEKGRRTADSVVSERALREIYLKGFEILCKESNAYCIMSTYGPVNGLWTASNYDLLTHILRKEWGFKGIVMSDWWARANEEGQNFTVGEKAAMVRSQNDIYMVVPDAEDAVDKDNLLRSLGTEKVTLGELQRCAMNVLGVIMRMPVMERFLGVEEACYSALYQQTNPFPVDANYETVELTESGDFPVEMISVKKCERSGFGLRFAENGQYKMELTIRTNVQSELAQLSLTILKDELLLTTVSLTGADKEWRVIEIPFGEVKEKQARVAFFFRYGGMELLRCRMVPVELTNNTEE